MPHRMDCLPSNICPEDRPIKCPDLSCVDDVSGCDSIAGCPPSYV